MIICREATVILVPIWKRGVFKRGNLKSLISHVLSFISWIKLIYDTVNICNFVIYQFNPTFEVQNMGYEDFQNAYFGNASFPNEALSYSCLWAQMFSSISFSNIFLRLQLVVKKCTFMYLLLWNTHSGKYFIMFAITFSN